MASSTPPTPNRIERAHQMYREGRYMEALGFYTEALAMAKTKQQKIALHSNRAACYLKLHDFKKAAYECTSVLELDHDHTGALMLRAQTLVTLKEYTSALFDVNRLIELNPSSEVYQNLHARLKTQVSLAPIPESEAELEEEEEDEEEELHVEDTREMEVIDEKLYRKDAVVSVLEKDCGKPEPEVTSLPEKDREPEIHIPKPPDPDIKEPSVPNREPDPRKPAAPVPAPQNIKKPSSLQDSKGWQAIPKPKGHSALDYGRWDRVEDDDSEDDEDDDSEDEAQPQYRFRVRTVGVRSVK